MKPLLTSVQVALSASCPIAGIPRPGEPPFIFRRRLLADSLAGLTLESAEWDARLLVVRASSRNVRAKRVVFPLARQDAIREVQHWAKQQRKHRPEPLPLFARCA